MTIEVNEKTTHWLKWTLDQAPKIDSDVHMAAHKHHWAYISCKVCLHSLNIDNPKYLKIMSRAPSKLPFSYVDFSHKWSKIIVST